jgi:hypothetical protein
MRYGFLHVTSLSEEQGGTIYGGWQMGRLPLISRTGWREIPCIPAIGVSMIGKEATAVGGWNGPLRCNGVAVKTEC